MLLSRKLPALVTRPLASKLFFLSTSSSSSRKTHVVMASSKKDDTMKGASEDQQRGGGHAAGSKRKHAAQSSDVVAASRAHDVQAARDDQQQQQQPEATPSSSELPLSVVEEGRLYMLYKPKVEVEEVHSLSDVQRFYLVMDPLVPAGHRARLVIVPKKRLPGQRKGERGRERMFAYVEATEPLEQQQQQAEGEEEQKQQQQQGKYGEQQQEEEKQQPTTGPDERSEEPASTGGGGSGAKALIARLCAFEYETKTRGVRHQPPARMLAEAAYVIGRGGKRNAVHLAYKLEVPLQAGPAQAVFKVEDEGDMALSIKNPENRPPGAPTPSPAPAQYTEEQKQKFSGRAWIEADDSSLLDVPGAELLLIGAGSGDERGHLGEVGQELYEVFDSDHEEDTEQAVKKLKSEVEPDVGASGSGGDKGGGGDDDEPIPIAPAVTGELK